MAPFGGNRASAWPARPKARPSWFSAMAALSRSCGPPRDEDVTERRSATLLWRNMRDLLAEGRRKPLLITWYGVETAVLEPLPIHWQEGDEL